MTPIFIFGIVIDVLVVAVCSLAWWKGDVAERWGSTINLVGTVTAFFAHYVLARDALDVALLFADGFLAFGLLFLGVRYASLWIGAAMLLQAVQFLLHTYYFVLEIQHDLGYAVVNNLVSLGILAAIFAGILRSLRRRLRSAAA
jgi:hypothetical protein